MTYSRADTPRRTLVACRPHRGHQDKEDRDGRNHGRARLLAITLTTLAAMALPAAAAHAALGPAPITCNAYSPAPNCFYDSVSGTDTFKLSSHFVHVGQTITGTAKWEIGGQGKGEYPAVGSVAVDDYGQGLHLLHCHGKLHDSNGKAKWNTDKAFEVTKGTTTCTWRAVSATGWSTDPGLVVAAGGETFKAGDFYAVEGRTVLEGTVRIRNDRRADPQGLGVPGAKVHITGPHHTQYNATVNANGYWYVELSHGGDYHVEPIIPRKYQVGKDYVSPKSDDVHVALGGVGKSAFTVKDSLRLTLSLSTTRVPATGGKVDGSGQLVAQPVTGTLKVTDAGAPAAGMKVSIRPFDGSRHTLATLPVLGRICSSAGNWPALSNAADVNQELTGYTDANGEITFTLYPGTIPGELEIDARPLDTDGITVQDTDLARTNPQVKLHITPMGGGENVVKGIQTDISRYGYLMGSTGSWQLQLQRAAASGALGAVNVAPVHRRDGGGSGAMLIYPAGTRITATADAPITPPAGSVVAEPDLFAGQPGFPSDFATAARQGYIARYPTSDEWRNGASFSWGTGGWKLGPVAAPPAAMLSADYSYQAFGFPYVGGC